MDGFFPPVPYASQIISTQDGGNHSRKKPKEKYSKEAADKIQKSKSAKVQVSRNFHGTLKEVKKFSSIGIIE